MTHTHGKTDTKTEEQMQIQTNRWSNTEIHKCGQTDRVTDTQTEKDTQKDIQMFIQKDTETHTQGLTDRARDTDTLKQRLINM
jgi:hypothetical protein